MDVAWFLTSLILRIIPSAIDSSHDSAPVVPINQLNWQILADVVELLAATLLRLKPPITLQYFEI
jgi:hypothetical protein